MMHIRHPNWEERLNAFMEASQNKTYAYGQWDCGLFSAGAVKAITGKDHARGQRGQYKSAIGAVGRIKGLGFDSLTALLDSLFEQKPIGFAQRGDLVMAKDGIPAVCMGDVALSVGDGPDNAGLVRVPRVDWVKAWVIGEQHADVPKKRKRRKVTE